MKEYRNLLIASNKTHIITASFANCNSAVKYNHIKKSNKGNIDLLKILNNYMGQIIKWKRNNKALNVYYITLPSKLCKVIKDRLYLNWNENNVSEKEIEQWKIFNALYKLVFSDVYFKPDSIYNSKDVNNAYKHVVFTKKTFDLMNNLLDAYKEQGLTKELNEVLVYNE
jgi:hypothetical protein